MVQFKPTAAQAAREPPWLARALSFTNTFLLRGGKRKTKRGDCLAGRQTHQTLKERGRSHLREESQWFVPGSTVFVRGASARVERRLLLTASYLMFQSKESVHVRFFFTLRGLQLVF